jgi:DNA-binding response OmpR family regulator
MFKEQTTCPCCGAALKPSDILVDLNTNTITYGGRSVKVSSQVAEYAYIIWRASPGTATQTDFEIGVYGIEDLKNPVDYTKVIVTNLRRSVSHLGLDVENVTKRGYRFSKVRVTRPRGGGFNRRKLENWGEVAAG